MTHAHTLVSLCMTALLSCLSKFISETAYSNIGNAFCCYIDVRWKPLLTYPTFTYHVVIIRFYHVNFKITLLNGLQEQARSLWHSNKITNWSKTLHHTRIACRQSTDGRWHFRGLDLHVRLQDNPIFTRWTTFSQPRHQSWYETYRSRNTSFLCYGL